VALFEPSLGWKCVAHAFVPGIPLYDAALDADLLPDFAVRLGNFVKNLHQVAPSSLGCQLPSDPLGRLDETRRGRGTREQLFQWKHDGVLSGAVISRLFRVLDRWPGPPTSAADVLIHGDLHGRNLLVTADGRLSGVLDWVDVHVGHRETDLSTAFEVLPAANVEGFFSAYGPVDADAFSRAHWRAIDHLTRTFAGAIEKRDEAFARATRDALIETSLVG
jgi:aminoglycoside phosphotransferase (APT) family kinase protein